MPDIYFAIRLIQSKQQVQIKTVEDRKSEADRKSLETFDGEKTEPLNSKIDLEPEQPKEV